MKHTIFSNWNFMRLIRLALGIVIIVQSIVIKDWAVGLLGIFFTSLPIFNIGCCSTGGCYTTPKKITESNKDVVYEEVV
jgi:hypothetical protein